MQYPTRVFFRIIGSMDIKRHNKRRISTHTVFSSHMALGGLVLAVVFLGNATWNVYRTYHDARARESRTKDELSALVLREERLVGEIARLNTEEGREEEMRERFGVGREGEHLIVITKKELENSDGSHPIVPWYKMLWNRLFEKE